MVKIMAAIPIYLTQVGVAITDICTGLFAHGAIMAALLARTETGIGQRIDLSLLESQVATLANVASNYLVCGVEGKRWGTAHESIVPYQVTFISFYHFFPSI